MHRQMTSPRLGVSVKSARERLGWSREALAYHSGLSWAAITQIESGRRREVRVSSLVALASALGVSVDYLVGGAATASPGLLKHRVVSYGSDDAYLAAAVPFLLEGLERDDCVMAVTTSVRIGALRDALGSNATHVEFREASEWYVSLHGAASAYRTFVQERLERGVPWIRIIGEPVWGGWSDEETAEWFRYEAMINLSFASSPATILCTYDTSAMSESAIESAHRTHPQIASAGDVTASATYQEPEDYLLSVGVS
jgi:transcriptional regulator with XRE-family HTH domain